MECRTDRCHAVNVFLPSLAVENESCVLLGTKNRARGCCTVTNYISLNNFTVAALVANLCSGIDVVGIFINMLSGFDPEKLESCQAYIKTLSEWIVLKKRDEELPSCTLCGRWQCCNTEVYAVVLLFSATDLNASYMLESQNPDTTLGQLTAAWQQGMNFQKKCYEQNISIIKGFIPDNTTWIDHCCLLLQQYLFTICGFCTSLITWLSNNSSMGIWHYLPRPAVLCQLHKKFKVIHMSIHQHKKSKLDRIRLYGVLWQQILDICLGVSIMYFVSCHSEHIGAAIMHWAKDVATELEQLLKWMMGVPAGLKLNKELAHFLGQFFLYHIYLWKGYLWFLYHLWTGAVWCISVSGWLGLCIQLSLVQDLLSVMTLHCYCFYVYAARLYSLQIYALRSLWRLFRGKKWNPLFQRIDSSSYDVDQLFIGTLLFTILLFLLPTTGLFYATFTGLRLLVLAIQGTLCKLVTLVDCPSVYGVYLRMVTPSKVAANLQLHVQPRGLNQPLYHTIQLHPVSLSQLIHLISSPVVLKHEVTDSWTVFLETVITGKLI